MLVTVSPTGTWKQSPTCSPPGLAPSRSRRTKPTAARPPITRTMTMIAPHVARHRVRVSAPAARRRRPPRRSRGRRAARTARRGTRSGRARRPPRATRPRAGRSPATIDAAARPADHQPRRPRAPPPGTPPHTIATPTAQPMNPETASSPSADVEASRSDRDQQRADRGDHERRRRPDGAARCPSRRRPARAGAVGSVGARPVPLARRPVELARARSAAAGPPRRSSPDLRGAGRDGILSRP